MTINSLIELKSGTDIRGVATDHNPLEKVTLTDDVVKMITSGFVAWLLEYAGNSDKHLTVSIGHDPRLSAKRISAAVKQRLLEMGVNVIDLRLASTPAVFMSTIHLNCDGAIQITASHHPVNKNGFKFFTKSGGLESSDIEEILEYAENDDIVQKGKTAEAKKIDYMHIYSKHLRDIICREVNSQDYNHPLKGFKIIVDASNGAGGFYAHDVLKPLGADISGSQFLEPDGNFPNHAPNPEDKEAMRSISEAVIKAKADLGIIFDTDVDRAAVVNSDGLGINKNRLIALASNIALETNLGGTIVTDSITSDGLKEYIESELKGVHFRYKRGYKNVINKAIELNSKGINCPLAIETSGHAAFKENYFLDDGAYLVTKIIIKMVKLRSQGNKLETLIKNLKEPLENTEIRIPIEEKQFKALGNQIIKDLKDYAESQPEFNLAKDNYEGIKVSFNKENGDGWFLLRLSVHDPVMPINAQSNTKGGTKLILKKLYNFMKDIKGIDISALRDFVIQE